MTELTKVFGTLAVVYGWFVEPIGWVATGLVWLYAIAWLFVNSAAKSAVLRLLREGTETHRRHLQRVTARPHPQA